MGKEKKHSKKRRKREGNIFEKRQDDRKKEEDSKKIRKSNARGKNGYCFPVIKKKSVTHLVTSGRLLPYKKYMRLSIIGVRKF